MGTNFFKLQERVERVSYGLVALLDCRRLILFNVLVVSVVADGDFTKLVCDKEDAAYCFKAIGILDLDSSRKRKFFPLDSWCSV